MGTKDSSAIMVLEHASKVQKIDLVLFKMGMVLWYCMMGSPIHAVARSHSSTEYLFDRYMGEL